MYSIYTKRIIKINLPVDPKDTPEELLERVKNAKWDGQVVSDTLLIEDESGIIQAKEKVIYDGKGKEFTFDRAFPGE